MNQNLTKPLALFSLALAIIVGLSGCVMLDDSGTWRGSVVNRDDYRDPYSCNMETKITHTSEEIILHHIANDCASYQGLWHPGKFEVHGTTVWKNGRAVGWAKPDGSVSIDITEPNRFFDEPYPYAASRVVISWVQRGDRMEYFEEAYFAGRVQRTQGWLTRDFL